jgi:hypothetical protein
VLFDEEETTAADEQPMSAARPSASMAETDEPDADTSADEGLSLFRDFINTLDIDDDEKNKGKKQ